MKLHVDYFYKSNGVYKIKLALTRVPEKGHKK